MPEPTPFVPILDADVAPLVEHAFENLSYEDRALIAYAAQQHPGADSEELLDILNIEYDFDERRASDAVIDRFLASIR